MGCSHSKDVDIPSKNNSKETSWDASLHKGLAIQVDRSLKTTNGGYITTIVSANYGSFRRPAGPVNASEQHDVLRKPHVQGNYPQHNMNVLVKSKSNTQLTGKTSSDTVLGVPVHSSGSSVTAEKPTEGFKENLETINILELMEGLAEAEVSSSYEAQCVNPKPSMLSVHAVGPSKVSAHKMNTEAPTSAVCLGKMAARRPRPKSFSSIKSIEDVEFAVSERQSKTPPRLCEKGSGKATAVMTCNGEGSLSIGGIISGYILQDGVSMDDETEPKGATCGTVHNEADMSASVPRGDSFRSPDNLQRALSFKYIFNDTSNEKPDSNSGDFQINEVNSGIHGSNSFNFHTARLLSEGDGNSDPPSPEFSAAASLKDWLPSTNHPSKGFAEPSILEALQSLKAQRVPHHSSNVQSTCIGGVSNVEFQDTPLTTDVEIHDAPMFDPELLDTFEKAMKQLSKEEWDAVRSMEDSPRNFLHLVNSLKKSSSNTVRKPKFSTNGNTTDMHCVAGMVLGEPTDHANLEDGRLKKSIVDKKIRQNSWDVKKTFVKAARRDDKEKTSLVFYSTTTQTDAKLYEDCNQVRCILRSLVGASYEERSVSEHLEHEQELMHALDVSAAVVPTICVKGKYLVGVDSIVQLYKKGVLRFMLKEGASLESKTSTPCICRGGKFLICPLCKGRRKLSRFGEGTLLCRHCSGTGLIKCINCSST